MGEKEPTSPEIADSQESDSWKWQDKNALRDVEALSQILPMDAEEKATIEKVARYFPFRITPYYASLIDPSNPHDPIKLQVIPDVRELDELQEQADQNGKDLDEYLSELSHEGRVGGWDRPEELIDRQKSVEQKYPNRAAWLITRDCPSYCRHCVRKVMSEDTIVPKVSSENINSAIEAIKRNLEINDVLITGGDPFMLPTAKIKEITERLLQIDHVTTIRFGTRTPVTMPQRINSDPELMATLRELNQRARQQEKNIWIMTQFNHPREITPESKQALGELRETGCELGNQAVLLKEVNDNIETLEELFHSIARLGVRPYYLYQGIPTPGANFRYTTISKGLEIMRQMYERQNLSGFEKPRYIIADSDVGKIPLPPPGVEYSISESLDHKGRKIEEFSFLWKDHEIKYRIPE